MQIRRHTHTNVTNLSLEVVRKMLQLEQLERRLWHFHHFLSYYLSLLIRSAAALSLPRMILLPGKTLLQKEAKKNIHTHYTPTNTLTYTEWHEDTDIVCVCFSFLLLFYFFFVRSFQSEFMFGFANKIDECLAEIVSVKVRK